ncbi:MAG: type II toxin-antitoxin system HipA family toxin [Clostridia bacterium]|nr:type II toxin-antitoxin system HipA family toxin [Clostridia bacterium]
MEKKIYVYENWSSHSPRKIGTLFIDSIRGNEHSSFQFDPAFLTDAITSQMLIIDPDLSLIKGRQFPAHGKSSFGIFSDSSPDRWGRLLMERREKLNADKEDRKPSKLLDSDYLLGVFDESRMGALRFALEDGGPFLSDDKETAAPPWATLRTLEQASREFEKDENALIDKWLNQLLRPGSSLGGARPKATIQDPDGNLWIAKFPSRKDTSNIGAWEKVAHELARLCGLNVPESKLEKFSTLGSTFLVKRFDRGGHNRVHFASAMTMLGKQDGDHDASYLDIVDFIKAYGTNVKTDLIELWKRIVFSMAISNTDDHLRNHGFILVNGGWQLSPLYDVNPVPYGNDLALCIDEADSSISIELAIETAKHYGIDEDTANKYASNILTTVKNNWEALATKYGLSRGEIENMRPAFRESEKYSG